MPLKNFGLSVGDYCHCKDTPHIGWAKILEIGYFGKTYKIAKCEWTLHKKSNFGLIKYFALRNLTKRGSIDGSI